MTLRVNHLLEVKRWVMSLGPDCEVLEPEQLRSEVAAELLQAVRQYGRV
jgi:predicted DNA-binding transcriptional regulator YafY